MNRGKDNVNRLVGTMAKICARQTHKKGKRCITAEHGTKKKTPRLLSFALDYEESTFGERYLNERSTRAHHAKVTIFA